jgi:hypothetical protein
MQLAVFNYSRSGFLSLGNLNPISSVVLPLPAPLIDPTNISYEDKAIGAFTGNALRGAAGVVQGAINKAFGTDFNSFGIGREDTEGSSGKNVLGAAQALTNPLIPSNVGASIQAFSGYSPNQFMTILLNGPKYRTYEFTWRFSPKSPDEANSLRQIIRALKNWSSPGLAASGIVWSFPKIFQPSFMPNSKYLYKFKPSVIESITANYSPGGQPGFYRASEKTDGLNAPEGVDLALRFIELEYWITGDFNNNNDPMNNKSDGSSPDAL